MSPDSCRDVHRVSSLGMIEIDPQLARVARADIPEQHTHVIGVSTYFAHGSRSGWWLLDLIIASSLTRTRTASWPPNWIGCPAIVMSSTT
jgi:hypothetical protein